MINLSIGFILPSHAYNNMPALVIGLFRYYLVIHPFSQIRVYNNYFDVYDSVSDGKDSIL